METPTTDELIDFWLDEYSAYGIGGTKQGVTGDSEEDEKRLGMLKLQTLNRYTGNKTEERGTKLRDLAKGIMECIWLERQLKN